MSTPFLFLLRWLQLLNVVALGWLLAVSVAPRQGAIMYLMFLPHLCIGLLVLSVPTILIGIVSSDRLATAYGGLLMGIAATCWGLGILIEG
jgi:hypothetical protein